MSGVALDTDDDDDDDWFEGTFTYDSSPQADVILTQWLIDNIPLGCEDEWLEAHHDSFVALCQQQGLTYTTPEEQDPDLLDYETVTMCLLDMWRTVGSIRGEDVAAN